MSQHTVCDKCAKVIDHSEGWVQIVQTELTQASDDAGVSVVTPAATFDYHHNHAPKLVKPEPEPEPDPPAPNQDLPDPEDA